MNLRSNLHININKQINLSFFTYFLIILNVIKIITVKINLNNIYNCPAIFKHLLDKKSKLSLFYI